MMHESAHPQGAAHKRRWQLGGWEELKLDENCQWIVCKDRSKMNVTLTPLLITI